MANEKEVKVESIETTTMEVELVGETPLILKKKARSFELQEIFKQSHPKGTTIPKELNQPYSLWERLITSIHWEKPITFHDDDHTLYTEEEWENYMETNRPCILPKAFKDSWKEAFVTFFKDKTGKNGTDIIRSVNIIGDIIPVDFASAGYSQHLTPNNSKTHTNVLGEYNIFDGWKCKLKIVFCEDVFPETTIISLIKASGQFLGIGTRRKENFGQYSIGKVKIIK